MSTLRRTVLVLAVLAGLLPAIPLPAEMYLQYPRGLNDRVRSGWMDSLKAGTALSIPDVVRPPVCYRFSFVSARADGADNIFTADSCGGETRQITGNRNRNVLYGGLKMSRQLPTLAFHETAFGWSEDAEWSIVGEWLEFADTERGATSLLNTDSDYDGSSDYRVAGFAWGPNDRIAFVQTDPEHRNPAVMTNPALPYRPEGNRTVYRPADWREIFAGLDWTPATDAANPSYGKILVSKGTYGGIMRLHVIDTVSGGRIFPLQDESDTGGRGFGLDGEQPAVGRGNKLAFVRNVDGEKQLWTCELDFSRAVGEAPVYLCSNLRALGTGATYESPCWTYDAKKILAGRNEAVRAPNAAWDIVMIDAESGASETVTDFDGKDRFPACFPILYEAVTTTSPEYVPVYKEPVRLYPAQQTVQPAQVLTRCKTDDQCPKGQVCRDNACRKP